MGKNVEIALFLPGIFAILERMKDTGVGGSAVPDVLTLEELQRFLARLDTPIVGDDSAGLVSRLGVVEQIKGALAGMQARATVELADRELARDKAAGVSKRHQGRGIGAMIGFACRISPWAGTRRLALARALADDLPRTMRALGQGDISEWRATIIAGETAMLNSDQRRRVDAEVAAGMAKLGDRQLRAAVSRAAYQMDPQTFVKRRARAETDRRVTVRPAPDAMACLTGLVPVAQGVAAYAALDRHAKAVRAAGDPRSRGQIMSDTMIERLTGQASAAAVPVEVNVTMDFETLFAGASAPATMSDYGPIPADLARELAVSRRAGADGQVRRGQAWIRRLFTRPDGQLIAMDSRRRVFDGGIRDLLVLRDQLCRTPYCNAPIRHTDHAVPVRDRGQTRVANGQGLCESCNYCKDLPGWRSEVIDDGSTPGKPQRIRTTLPTGHAYDSTAPPIAPEVSFVERRLRIGLALRSPPPDTLTG